MTNFIYNMQDELFNLNMILPVGEFSPIKKLVDHIEAQGKQLRELNAAIAKRNKTIYKYECEKKDLQERNSYLYKKVVELNNGIRDSEDLTWKQKYEALRKKCQEYKNSESDAITSTIETLTKANNELNNRRAGLIRQCDALYDENKELKEKNKKIEENFKKLEHRRNELIIRVNELRAENKKLETEKKTACDGWWKAEKALEDTNKLLDEYMTKYGVASRTRDGYISEFENKVKELKWQVADRVRLNNVLKSKLVSIGELADKINDVILSEE